MNNLSFISLVLIDETKPSAVASLSSEEAKPSEDKGTDCKLHCKVSKPKRTFHKAVFSFVWKLLKSQLNPTEIGTCWVLIYKRLYNETSWHQLLY